MCLTLKKNSKKRITKRNIIVYKSFYENRSEFEGYLYKIGVENPNQCLIKERVDGHRYVVHEGYHSWKTPYFDDNICKIFVIPKGTEYYRGIETYSKRGYVSSNIIFEGTYNNKNLKTVKEKYKISKWDSILNFLNL